MYYSDVFPKWENMYYSDVFSQMGKTCTIRTCFSQAALAVLEGAAGLVRVEHPPWLLDGDVHRREGGVVREVADGVGGDAVADGRGLLALRARCLSHKGIHGTRDCGLRRVPLHPETIGFVPRVELRLKGGARAGQ